jgi:helix-turn-helix DNA-binding domain protein
VCVSKHRGWLADFRRWDGAFVYVTFKRPGKIESDTPNDNLGSKDDTVNDTANDTLNDTAKLILQSIVENPHITYQGIVEKTAIARATVARYMSKLKELGYILRHDSDKNGYWEVIKKS